MTRHAKAKHKDVRSNGVDGPNDRFVFRTSGGRVKIAVLHAYNLQCGKSLPEPARRARGHTRTRAEEEKCEAARLGKLRQLPHPIGIRDALRNPLAEQSCAPFDPEPVTEHDVAAIEKRAKPRLFPRQVHRVDVHVGDNRAPVFNHCALDTGQQLRRRDGVEGDTQHVNG